MGGGGMRGFSGEGLRGGGGWAHLRQECGWALLFPGGRDAFRREGTAEAAPEAVRQAVGGGCQSGWGRLVSVTNAIEAGTCRLGDSGWT